MLKKYPKILQLTLLYLSIVSLIIWFCFVANGYFRLGYLPKYGDPEFILSGNENIHFTLLLTSLYVTIYGSICWIALTIIKTFFDIEFLNSKKYLIGTIGFALNFIFMFSSQFVWILD